MFYLNSSFISNLVLDPTLNLLIPTTLHPSKLKEAINYALEKMIRDGYYEELFHIDHRPWITNAFCEDERHLLCWHSNLD